MRDRGGEIVNGQGNEQYSHLADLLFARCWCYFVRIVASMIGIRLRRNGTREKTKSRANAVNKESKGLRHRRTHV